MKWFIAFVVAVAATFVPAQQVDVWTWSSVQLPVNADGSRAYDNAESMVWIKAEDLQLSIDRLAARPLERRGVFIWKPEKHDPAAWADPRETRLKDGANLLEGYLYWYDYWTRLKEVAPDGLQEIIIDYEGRAGISYWQLGREGTVNLVNRMNTAYQTGAPLAVDSGNHNWAFIATRGE